MNLEEGTYQFYVISTDAYNYTILDNNKGSYYTFTILPKAGPPPQPAWKFISGGGVVLIIVICAIVAIIVIWRKLRKI
ncbi:MAG: hypothetical protein AB1485_00345 [Candidatus Thermoplasmatota archaeon]